MSGAYLATGYSAKAPASQAGRWDPYDAPVSPKAKVEIAKEHLAKAQEELIHKELNFLRKAIFYDGEELEEHGFSVEDAVAEVETVVGIASERAS
jgi:hypothetical protein